MTIDLHVKAPPQAHPTLEGAPGVTPGTLAPRGTPVLSHHARQRCSEMQVSTKVVKRIWRTHTHTAPAGARGRADRDLTERPLVVYSPEHPEYLVLIPPEDRHKANPRVITVLFNTPDRYLRRGTDYRSLTPAQFTRLRLARTPSKRTALVPAPTALRQITANLDPLRTPNSLTTRDATWAQDIISTLGGPHHTDLVTDGTTTWRIEHPQGRPQLTVRTTRPDVDLHTLQDHPLVRSTGTVTDVYTRYDLRPGRVLSFTLHASPSAPTRRGRYAHITDIEEQVDWLQERMRGAFTLPDHPILGTPDVLPRQDVRLRDGRGHTLWVTVFTGSVMVDDPDEAKHLLAEGVGSPFARQAGLGLLTLGPTGRN